MNTNSRKFAPKDDVYQRAGRARCKGYVTYPAGAFGNLFEFRPSPAFAMVSGSRAVKDSAACGPLPIRVFPAIDKAGGTC